ncbi:AP2 domain-containing protein [Paracidovorax avenae]|nr:AP2 domain-containing protein [Paracidovorax avenae]
MRAPTERIYGLTPRYAGDEIVRWSVAIARRGERFAQEFVAADYGSAEGAKTAAIAWRDDVLKRIPAMSKREFSSIVRSNNTSGVPGVYRRTSKGFTFWCAQVNLPNGKTRKRIFAVVKHGEERAKQLAIEARTELLNLLDGWLVHHQDAVPTGHAPPQAEHCTPRPPKPRAEPSETELSPDKRVYRMTWKRTLRDGRAWSRDYWVAEYSTKTQPVRRKSFAVSKYGELEARRLALAQRREWLDHPPSPSDKQERNRSRNSTSVKPSS